MPLNEAPVSAVTGANMENPPASCALPASVTAPNGPSVRLRTSRSETRSAGSRRSVSVSNSQLRPTSESGRSTDWFQAHCRISTSYSGSPSASVPTFTFWITGVRSVSYQSRSPLVPEIVS